MLHATLCFNAADAGVASGNATNRPAATGPATTAARARTEILICFPSQNTIDCYGTSRRTTRERYCSVTNNVTLDCHSVGQCTRVSDETGPASRAAASAIVRVGWWARAQEGRRTFRSSSLVALIHIESGDACRTIDRGWFARSEYVSNHPKRRDCRCSVHSRPRTYEGVELSPPAGTLGETGATGWGDRTETRRGNGRATPAELAGAPSLLTLSKSTAQS